MAQDHDEDGHHGDGDGGRCHRPWLWALSSSLVTVLGLGLLASYPAEAREARSYDRSARCTPNARPGTCVEVVDAVVEGKRKVGFRRPDHYVDLRVGEGARFPPRRQPASVEVEDTGDVYDSLRPGDRVELGYWGRAIARITKPGVGTVETVASPSFDAGVALGLGVALPVAGGLSLRFAVRLRRRAGSWTRKARALRSRPSLPRLLAGAGLAGALLGSIVIADSNTYDIAEAIAIWVVTGFLGAALALAFWVLTRVVRRLRTLL